MRFQFNDRKTAQAAGYLLKQHGGPLNYMVLIKLLYMADREMLLAHGRPITGDHLVSMRHGPVLSRVLDFINEGPRSPKTSSWFEYVGQPSGYEVAPQKSEPETDEMSPFELRLLAEVHNKYAKMEKWELVDYLHRVLPEWTDPGSSSCTIDPVDILRAEDRSDDEIERVRRTAEDTWFLDSLSR